MYSTVRDIYIYYMNLTTLIQIGFLAEWGWGRGENDVCPCICTDRYCKSAIVSSHQPNIESVTDISPQFLDSKPSTPGTGSDGQTYKSCQLHINKITIHFFHLFY
jgi:hypothetical protein